MIDAEAEERAVAFLLKDISAGQYLPYFDPRDFKDQTWEYTFRALKECFERYKRQPTLREFWSHLQHNHPRFAEMSILEQTDWGRRLAIAYKHVEITPATKHQLGEWIVRRKMAEIAVETDPPVPIEERRRQAVEILQKVGPLLSTKDASASLILSDESLQEELDYREGKTADPFPTGFPSIDKHLPHGGLERGDLALFMGPRERGKSFALLQQTMTALRHGRRVLHISLESTNKVARRRLFAHMSGIGTNTPCTETEYREAIAAWWEAHPKAHPSRALFKAMPSMRTTIDDLLMLIDTQESIHGPIDMVVIDYLNLMKPSAIYKDRWQALGDMSQELASVMVERNKVCHSAVQGNRSAETAEILQGTHVAGSIDMFNAPSLILTLEQDPHEKEGDIQPCRYGVQKNRHGKSKFRVPCLFCPNEARYWEDPTGVILSFEGKKEKRRREEEVAQSGGNVVQIGDRRKVLESGGPGFGRRSTGGRYEYRPEAD